MDEKATDAPKEKDQAATSTTVLLANIEHAYYPAGHMRYVQEPSRVQQSKDLAAFIRGASAQ